MHAHRILEIVRDVASWKGDVYNLAMTIAAEQKSLDAGKADDLGAPEVAEAIRGAD